VPLGEQALGRGGGRSAGTQYASPRDQSTSQELAVNDLTTKERDRLRKDQFAYVDRDGGEHLPIHDESHARNAIARFNQTDFESKAAKERARKKILAAAKRHDIEIDEGSNVRERAD
jgi:hypothetical protein